MTLVQNANDTYISSPGRDSNWATGVFVFLIGFVPPSQLKTGSPVFFVAFLVVGLIVMCGTPLLIHRFRKPSWSTQTADDGSEDQVGDQLY